MKDEALSKFIVSDDQDQRVTEELIKKAIKYGRISESGSVIIDTDLSRDNKAKLSLALRFLGHSLNDTIPSTLRPIELSRILGERVEAAGSRLSELSRSGFAKRVGHGLYEIQVYKLEKLFDDLVSDRTSTPENFFTKSKIYSSNRKAKSLTGVGRDIEDLINDGFLKIPKTVSEIKRKLDEEIKFHDIRVIDTTIRKTFVSRRRTLKRIEMRGKGKSRWQYVNR